MKELHDLILKPLLTEKSTLLREKENKIVLQVRKDANKIEIKNAVEAVLKVKVEAVNVVIMPGKVKRLGRFEGKRGDWKKAVVTLKPNEKIGLFEGM